MEKELEEYLLKVIKSCEWDDLYGEELKKLDEEEGGWEEWKKEKGEKVEEFLKNLREYGVNKIVENEWYYKSLLYLSIQWDNEVVSHLLLKEENIDVNLGMEAKKKNIYPLYDPSNVWESDIVKETPLSLAFRRGNFFLCETLLNHPCIEVNEIYVIFEDAGCGGSWEAEWNPLYGGRCECYCLQGRGKQHDVVIRKLISHPDFDSSKGYHPTFQTHIANEESLLWNTPTVRMLHELSRSRNFDIDFGVLTSSNEEISPLQKPFLSDNPNDASRLDFAKYMLYLGADRNKLLSYQYPGGNNKNMIRTIDTGIARFRNLPKTMIYSKERTGGNCLLYETIERYPFPFKREYLARKEKEVKNILRRRGKDDCDLLLKFCFPKKFKKFVVFLFWSLSNWKVKSTLCSDVIFKIISFYNDVWFIILNISQD